MGVVQVPEGDVACAAGYVEDVLGWGVGRVGGETWVEGGNVVVSVRRRLLAILPEDIMGRATSGEWCRMTMGQRGRCLTNFHTRCQPKDIRSFMRSYVSATLLNTSATRFLFSASVTVSNPKWVGRLEVSLWVASRVGVVEEKCRDDVDIMAGPERRFRRHDRTVLAPRPRTGLGAAIVT